MAAERMTATEWAEEPDARRLLEFAAPRLCHRHVSLVQVELAEHAWRVSQQVARPAASLVAQTERLASLVREWCFFRTTRDALRAATLALDAVRPVVVFAEPRPGSADALSVLAVVRAAAFAGGFDLPVRIDGLPRGAPLFAPVLAATRALLSVGDEARPGAALATLVRRRIPYPKAENREWLAFPGIVFAGEFVLRIDGTAIGDVVRRGDYGALTGPRAVAFDAAQEHAEAESEAQARDRETAGPRLAARLLELEAEARRQEEVARRDSARKAEAEVAQRRAREAAAAQRRAPVRPEAILRAEAHVRAEFEAHQVEAEARAAVRRVERWSSVSAWLESTSLGELNGAMALALSLALGMSLFINACRLNGESAHGRAQRSVSTHGGGER